MHTTITNILGMIIIILLVLITTESHGNNQLYLVSLKSAPNFTDWAVENEALVLEPKMGEEACALRKSILEHFSQGKRYYWCEHLENKT